MSMGELLASGMAAVFNPGMFLMVCVAIILGTIFGALPGVSATMAVALGLTFTYTMEPIPAIVFLVAIYCSSITGGSITAILFKIPGVPSSAPTTFDGYPMAQRGEAGKALGVALLASGNRRSVLRDCDVRALSAADQGCSAVWSERPVRGYVHGSVHPDLSGQRPYPHLHHLRSAGSAARLRRSG